MRILFSFLVLFITTLSFAQSKGTITGVLTDKDMNNETLPFANVMIKGTTIGATTDEDGKYTLSVPAGTHTVVFSFLGYESETATVTVKAGETIKLNKALGAGSVQIDEVILTATVNREKESALLLEQKGAVEIKQSIGATEMSRKGVSTVEQGVTKISGVSKVADRGIFVRGLDDRYNYLQINGLNFIPSDPNLKTLPLSFIPTDIVRNIDVFKTFNATLYQDFAGAAINVWTKDISSKPYTKISISAGYNSNTSFKNFKTSKDSDTDILGYTGDSRSLPTVFGEGQTNSYSATPADSKNLFNSSWSPSKNTAPLATGTSITNSDSFELSNNRKAGYIVNFNFSNNYLSQSGQRRNLNSEGTAFKDFQNHVYTYNTQKSALAGFNLKKTNKYDFAFNLIYLQNSENSINEIAGENTDFITIDKPFFLRDMKYTENTSYGAQHLGSLYFNDKKHTIDYGIATTIGKNNMPDRKILITEGVGNDANYVTFNGVDPFRFFSILNNFNMNGKLEYQLGFGDKKDNKYANVVRLGYNGDITLYEFFNRTIRVNGGGTLTNTEMDAENPQEFFNQGFDNGNLFYRSTADPTSKVDITQFINAGLLSYTKNWNKITLDLGLRVEYMLRETKYKTETSTVNSPFLKKKYTPLDFNPVLNIKYMVTEKANIRLTASKTSTKPRLREILPFRYQDGDGSFTFGNPDLKNTINYNFDLKYEIFPNQSSLISATAFAKYIENPISRLLQGTSTGFLTKYDNFDSATLYGLELEASIGLDNLFKESIVAKKTSIGVNTIIMKSEEEASPERFPRLTSTSRSLQGASNFIINTDIAFEILKNESNESKVSLIYNTFSDRIYAVGTDGAADITQKPIHQLDFTWRNTFNKKYQLNLSVRNILNQKFKATQDPTNPIAYPERFSNVNQLLNLGINAGLEFSYTF
mgnify:CR=1 FL=1